MGGELSVNIAEGNSCVILSSEILDPNDFVFRAEITII